MEPCGTVWQTGRPAEPVRLALTDSKLERRGRRNDARAGKESSMIKGLAHVCLSAADLAAAERFYCGGLGLKKVFEFVRDGRVIGFYLEVASGAYVEVFQRDGIDAKTHGCIGHFCLEVDDIEQMGRQLAEHGYEATPKKLSADQSWQMWTTDPSGTRIEFHQYTERSSQRTHANCILN